MNEFDIELNLTGLEFEDARHLFDDDFAVNSPFLEVWADDWNINRIDEGMEPVNATLLNEDNHSTG